MKTRHAILWSWFCVMVCGSWAACFGWSHQGHILLTRLACLRIIEDPAAPKGLRDFLRQNMPHSLADCQSLAEQETVGAHPENLPQYDQGLDKWATMPDRVKLLPEGRVNIKPYGAPEYQMHYLDLEAFSGQWQYRDDLSGKPDVEKIPHDVSDPRWKRGGFVPLRVEEMYHKLAQALGGEAVAADPQAALEAAGFLAHYVEDSTQPHHATIDARSYSYLAGHVKQIPVTTQPDTLAIVLLRRIEGFDPHADIEWRLFENGDEPRATFRRQFFQDLLAEIDAQAAQRSHQPQPTAQTFDPFRWDLRTLSDSYDYLPFVGRAAQAGYATGQFDPAAFFGYRGQTHGRTMTMIQLIARQNAEAVLNVELVFRLAWEEAHRR